MAARLEQPAGQVLRGRNTPGSGDPFVELPLAGTIDAERFHRLTVTTALDGPFDLSYEPGGGSHGRLLWTQAGQPAGVFRYDSKDLVVYPGIRTYTVDLHTEPRDAVVDETSSRGPGWTGQIDTLRYDPNEDSAARTWTLDDIALRADDETSGGAFDIRWRDAGAGDPAGTTVSIYRDTDDRGFDGVPIVEGLVQRPGENAYRWETEDVPPAATTCTWWPPAARARAGATRPGRWSCVPTSPTLGRPRPPPRPPARARIRHRPRTRHHGRPRTATPSRAPG